MEQARRMLESGAAIPPQAQKYLDSHPELKSQLGEGSQEPPSGEIPPKSQPASKAGGKPAKAYETVAPPGPAYDWKKSSYLSTLFAKRLEPQEQAQVVHFGHELFDRREGGATVLENMPVSPSYIVGPGDQVIVRTWGRLEGTNRMTVDRDGRIFYPKIGSLNVAGKTFQELRGILQQKVGKIAQVKFEVSLGELKATRVSVVGEVRAPGWYNVSSLHTALQVLYLAGGVRDIGSMRQIELRREGKLARRIDLYDLLLHGDARGDLQLQQGDTLFVPVAGRTIAVVGDVRRPAIYELADEKTLEAAVLLGGGFSPSASTRRVQVERLDAHQSSIVLDIDTGDLAKGQQAFALADGDVVRVFPIVDADANVLSVEGNVRRPGRYEVKPGLTVGGLFPDAGAFLPETWFDYALLTRLVPPDLHKELVSVNLREIVLDKKPGADVALRGRDTLKVFPRSAFKDPHRVSISGEVRMAAPPPVAKQEAARPESVMVDARHGREPENKQAVPTTELEQERSKVLKTDETLAQNYQKLADKDPGEKQVADKLIAKKKTEEQEVEAVGQRAAMEKSTDEKATDGRAPVSDVLTFDIAEGTRLSDLVTLAGGLSRNALLSRAEVVRVDENRNFHTLYVDLGKAMASDLEANVVLQDEDRVRIHSIWETKLRQTVSVAGEVNDPGEYQLTEGMTLTDLVFKGGGFKESAYATQAELVRRQLAPGGELLTTQTVPVSLTKALDGDPASNLVLQAYDQLVVRRIPDYSAKVQITLGGEVRFPGSYVVPKGERLSAVIARAGGFTSEAYLHAAVFSRESTRRTQQAAIDRLTEELQMSVTQKEQEARAALDKEDLEFNQQTIAARRDLIAQLRSAKANGRVIIGLPDSGKVAGSSANILLENGDRLEVPKKMNVVTVVGRVYNPTGIVFNPDNADAGHYLSEVGGPMEGADTDHIFILRADGSVAAGNGFFGRRITSVALQPGDSIIVPQNLEQSRWLKDVRDITQILFQIAVATAVVIRL